jgi:hypothetical protein
MNFRPQKEISKVVNLPNKELGCAFTTRYHTDKSGGKMKKSIITSGY